MPYISNVAAQRMAEIGARVNARLAEISSETGLSFPELFGERRAALYSQSPAATTTATSTATIPASADIVAPTISPASVFAITAPDASDLSDLILPSGDTADLFPDLSLVTSATPPQIPKTIDELLNAAADAYGLHPALLNAVVMVRSGFDPSAVSESGSLGLMQLLPATAEGLGLTNPLDPQQNLDGGARNLMAQIIRYNGDVVLALAASELGPSELRRLGVTDRSQLYLLPAEVRGRLDEVRAILTRDGREYLLDTNYFDQRVR